MFEADGTNWEEKRDALVTELLEFCDSDQIEWKSKGVKSGVTVDVTNTEGSPLYLLKATSRVKAPVVQLLSFLKGIANASVYDPMFDTTASRVLEDINSTAQVVYGVFKLPWPLSGRDFVWFESNVLLEDGTAVIVVRSVERPSLMPPVSKYVRGEILATGWILRPDGDSGTHVTYLVQVDAKVWIPTFIINALSVDQALNVKRLREHFENM